MPLASLDLQSCITANYKTLHTKLLTFSEGQRIVNNRQVCPSDLALFISHYFDYISIYRACSYGNDLHESPLKYRYNKIKMMDLEEEQNQIMVEPVASLTLVEEAENGRLPDVVVETKMLTSEESPERNESYLAIAIQVFIPFLIAGFGMVGAGLVLDLVQV